MHCNAARNARLAFSLVELSIVLVILGLLTGGVLAGQSLIRAAELRSVSVEYSRYATAVQSFRDKYFALPGDMNNATSFWGVAHATPATCYTTASTNATTCNGNGDGFIAGVVNVSYEQLRFWQHLANAGLIEGTYTGTVSVATLTGGVNSPVSKLGSPAIWHIGSVSTPYSGNNTYFDGVLLGNYIQVNSWNGTGWAGALTPTEAWNIDTKMDDARPASGKITAPWSAALNTTGVNCTTAVSSATITATYNLADNNKDCNPWFIQQW